MSLLIFAIVVIIVAALVIWALDYVPLTAPFNNILRVLIILVAALVILNRAGVV